MITERNGKIQVGGGEYCSQSRRRVRKGKKRF